MTETEYKTIQLGGVDIRTRKPTEGQYNSLVRISKSLSVQGLDSDLYATQIMRLGTLLDSLIHPDDQQAADTLVLTGQVDDSDLIVGVVSAWKTEPEGKRNDTVAVVKANSVRVRRK